jgi:oxygen-independent coproporphyrinogen-3 oxidase
VVERSARLIKQAGAALHVRATITPRTAHRQRELAQYFHTLGADEVRLEPVYALPAEDNDILVFAESDAPKLAAAFLDAEAWANTVGLGLSCSLVRLDELHGPFCDVHRQTLHLIPDGRVVSCFFAVNGGDHVIGHFDAAADRFVLDQARIAALRAASAVLPAACRTCINVYHCSRGCPDRCLTTGQSGDSWRTRCTLARAITVGWLERSARQSTMSSGRARLGELLAPARDHVDTDAIVAAHQRLGVQRRIQARRMPPPLWRQRAYELDGPQIWQALGTELEKGQGPLSIYVHVPFCDRRCGFCDCLSQRLSPARQDQQLAFTDALVAEIEAWARRGSLALRPVTTVHLGGGSPAFLAAAHLERIVACLRQRLRIHAETEWAMEVTASSLSEEALYFWRDLGFSRLHVGVQTLEERVRLAAGRRLGRAEVLERLARATRGFVTSVDVIYGLPGETLAGFVDTLMDLDRVGVHGISLYAFNSSARNAAFRRRTHHVDDPMAAYTFFQTGDALLRERGLGRNHFAHYSRPADRNLYYRHEQRGEDLLALGPTADGAFGDVHYCHLDWPHSAGDARAWVGLEGGVRERPPESRLRPVIADLMCGGLGPHALEVEGVREHVAGWLDEGLVSRDAGTYVLTGTGAWFITDMIEELGAHK